MRRRRRRRQSVQEPPQKRKGCSSSAVSTATATSGQVSISCRREWQVGELPSRSKGSSFRDSAPSFLKEEEIGPKDSMQKYKIEEKNKTNGVPLGHPVLLVLQPGEEKRVKN